jgi:hypothetical protein
VTIPQAGRGAQVVPQDGDRERGVFEVDERHAAEALRLTWGDLYDDIGVQDGRWTARRTDRSGHVVTGATPDELDVNLRLDWACGSKP